MDKQTFLEQLQDVLQRDEALFSGQKFENIEEWDSLSMMAVIAFMDKNFGVKITLKDVNGLDIVEDLIKLAGI